MPKANVLLMTCILILVSVPGQAKIIPVPCDSSIQAGINGAVNGDTVLVADCHHYERISFIGKGILVASEFVIDSDSMHIINTVIDGDTNQTPLVSDTGSVVRFVNGEDSSSVLTGFTIKHGIGSPTEYSEFIKIGGGGIYSSFGCSPKISRCIVDSNSAETGYGGGIYTRSGNPVISNCRITNNSNGGIFLGGGEWGDDDDTAMIVGCMISRNSLFGIGYGRYANGPNPTITDDTIENNLGNGIGVSGRHNSNISGCLIRANTGSGIELGTGGPEPKRPVDEYMVSLTISNCIIEKNGIGIIFLDTFIPLVQGCLIKDNLNGGIYMSYDASITMIDCAVIGNTTEGGGGGISCTGWGGLITNCLFANNSAAYGGALFGRGYRITNCTFVGNSADTGSVIYKAGYGGDSLQNCILAFNIGGEPIVCATDLGTPVAAPFVTHTDIFGNEGGDWVGCIADQTGIEGNFSADPQFCDTASKEYHLWMTSPCVGTGQDGQNVGAYGVGCGFVLNPGPNQSGYADSTVSIAFIVQNAGTVRDSYSVDISDNRGWNIVPTHYNLTLDPAQSLHVSFAVRIPYVPLGTVDQLTLLAVSKTNHLARDSATLSVTCNAYKEGLDVSSDSNISGKANSHVIAKFYVQNAGIVADSCRLTVSDSLGWSIQPSSYMRTLNPGQKDSVLFDIVIPSVPVGTTDKITLQGVSLTNPFVKDTTFLLATCSSYNISIRKISDVGNDQGKQVFIEWLSFPGEDPLVTNFSVFRRKDSLITSSTGGSVVGPTLILKYPPGEWQWLFTIPAYGETLYSAILPTLRDSTKSEGIYWSYFFIRAGTDNPTVYFNSPVDSGYSLDNLSPSPPAGLLASHKPAAVTRLAWTKSNSEDSRYYTLYRDTISGCEPCTTYGFLAYSIDSVFSDSTAPYGKYCCYRVSTTDFSGNESYPSNHALGIRYKVGDDNRDGKITVADVVYEINYLFKGGPAPVPPEAGDVNCDGKHTISDVVYKVNYLFKGGPPPCDPDPE